MNTPYYTATVTNATRGWSYTGVQGDDPDPDARVQLVDPLTYAWGFESDLLPAQLSPFTASFNLAAKSAQDLPAIEIGDLVSLKLQVGATGPCIIDPPPMRVAEVPVELNVNGTYPARMTVSLSDTTTDWRGTNLNGKLGVGAYDNTLDTWRERFAEYGDIAGVALLCPSGWGDLEGPTINGLYTLAMTSWFYTDIPGTGIEGVTRLCNSHMPGGLTHTVAPVSGTPAGYKYVGPTTWQTARTYPEPATVARAAIIPASRRLPGSAGLPFTLALVGGQLRLVPVQPAAGNSATQLGIDAGWCDVPARARKSLEGKVSRVEYNVPEVNIDQGDGTYKHGALNYIVTAPGAGATRQVPSELYGGYDTGDSDPDYSFPPAAAVAAAPHFLTSDGNPDVPWAYDAFTLTASRIPQDTAEWLLPRIAPRVPGETDGDGRLVRHITIGRLDPDVRMGGRPLAGFVVAGSLTVQRGDVVFTLATLQGSPTWTDAPPAPISVGDLVTDFGGLTYAAVDPLVTFGDLAFTGAP